MAGRAKSLTTLMARGRHLLVLMLFVSSISQTSGEFVVVLNGIVKYFCRKSICYKTANLCLTEDDKVRVWTGRLKTRDWKTRDWKTRHQTARVENAGLENAAPDCRGGKRGSSTVWKAEVSVI